ncbi:uncharacterized protein LOC123556567 isoform X2 [Mercenaria mercenaria]|uniref:uncharacterized protein LOC123556567 isoform X2 n=1 Tax=Mercenaria mercenaria TaxID=6596 RepID=UPI00234F5D45|nr:uncharacterized protein LOC123556567 isoform X2 [Mercenaria mercenaria]
MFKAEGPTAQDNDISLSRDASGSTPTNLVNSAQEILDNDISISRDASDSTPTNVINSAQEIPENITESAESAESESESEKSETDIKTHSYYSLNDIGNTIREETETVEQNVYNGLCPRNRNISVSTPVSGTSSEKDYKFQKQHADYNSLRSCKRQTSLGCSSETSSIYENKISDCNGEDSAYPEIPSKSNLEEREKLKAQHLQDKRRAHLHRYEEMIIHYRPMIVSDVIVSQVLPYLQTCLNRSDISAIKSEQDQHKAVELLLDKLTACQEPGKWKMFVEALEECKYQTIVDALRRKAIAVGNDPIKILHMFSPQLREMIVPSEITAELLRTDVINSDDRYEIHQKECSAGAVAAADILLDRIPRKHPYWFEKFLEALKSINRPDLVNMLTFKKEIDTTTGKKACTDVYQLLSRPSEMQEKNEYTNTGMDTTTGENACTNANQLLSRPGEMQGDNEYTNTEMDTTTGKKACTNADQLLSRPSEMQEIYEYTNMADPEYMEKYQNVPDHFNPDDETVGGKETLSDYSHSACIRQTEVQSKNIQKLRDKGYNLVTEGNKLALELKEYETILTAHERNNDLLNKKRSLTEQIKIKKKEAADLKAAITVSDDSEDECEQKCVESLEDLIPYMAPSKRQITLDFRGKDVPATLLPSRIQTDTGITVPVKLYDVEQVYKDYEFYSECNFD